MSDLSEKFSQRVESGRDELGEPSQPSGHLNLGTSSGNSDHTKEFSDSARKSLREDEFYSGYTWNGFTGWKRFRLLRPGRGIYYDIRRRLPYYLSDITDGFSYRTFASCIRMYFVNLLPAIAYTLDMYRRTGHFFGVNESLFSSALAAMVFSVFAAQPITIVGVTGLIALFNFTIYDIVVIYEPAIYPAFIAWTGIWAAIMHFIVAIGNLCDYMRYITDFSSESFGMYVGIIYIIKGIEELVDEFSGDSEHGYLAVIVALLYFASVYFFEKIGNGTLFKPLFRNILSDYAYVICTVFWVGFVYIPGTLRDTKIATVPISKAFHPSIDRPWVIPFWELEGKWVAAAIPCGFLLMLLFYYDHNVSSLTAQAKQYPLKKPGGFHWDFFLLGCTTLVSAILGLPMPNGLIPQAPVHTDSLCIFETKLQLIKTEEGEGAEIRRPIVTIKRVVEQRLSHFFMGILLIATMTRPFLIVLNIMPRAVFAGVFFVVGWGSIESNGIINKFLHIVKENRFLPRNEPLFAVKRRKIVLYIALQMVAVAICVAISHTIAAIGFPIIICLLVPFRWKVMPRFFPPAELDALDALTADSNVVLASLGGRPDELGGMTEMEGLERRYSQVQRGAVRQRAGSLHL